MTFCALSSAKGMDIKMKEEQRLILLSVLNEKTNGERAEIDEILLGNVDWIEIAGIIMNHRLGGYFYNGCTKEQLKKMPKELRKNIKMLVDGQSSNQEKMYKYINELTEILENQNVRYAGLKGIIYGSCLYTKGTRRSNDMDLLVYEDDLEQLDILLSNVGYIQANKRDGKLVEATRKEKLIQRMNYHDLIPYMKETDDGIIEIDINFLFDGKDNLISKMKEKNLAVELLKKLIAEQVRIYRRTNVVKSEKFSKLIQEAMNRYLNGMLTNEQVIEELLNLAKQIAAAQKEGEKLGLTADELAFYDALTKPQAIKDFYENEELIAITKELADTLRKNRTIDWQKRDSARARMRMMIKKLLKKHKYPPEGMDDAVQTVMNQCELWTDNNDMIQEKDEINLNSKVHSFNEEKNFMLVAESQTKYGQE